jgi:hypothetical protein
MSYGVFSSLFHQGRLGAVNLLSKIKRIDSLIEDKTIVEDFWPFY